MAKITAQSEKYGMQYTITVEGPDEGNYQSIEVEPNLDNIVRELDYELKAAHMMGNYVPEEKSLLNAYNVLKHYFFDSTPDVIVRGNIGTVPYNEELVKSGAVY